MDLTRSAEAGDGGTNFAAKRRRRVSFAETTAVHIFKRDEDLDTPPDVKAAAETSVQTPVAFAQSGGEEEDEDRSNEFELFVERDADSCSPSSNAGSVDDDNLFGRISTSFIRSGDYSDVSDGDNPDICLDSTTISMHFSNILPSDDHTIHSVGTPCTPTGISLTNTTGSLLLSKDADEKTPRFELRKANGYSSDMTLVQEGKKRYDYGKLSPTMEGLLAKVNEAIQPGPRNVGKKLFSATNPIPKNSETLNVEGAGGNFDTPRSADSVESKSSRNVQRSQNDEPHQGSKVTLGIDICVSDDISFPLSTAVDSPSGAGNNIPEIIPTFMPNQESQFSAQKEADVVHISESNMSASTGIDKPDVVLCSNEQSPKCSSPKHHSIHRKIEEGHQSKLSSAANLDSAAKRSIITETSISHSHSQTPSRFQVLSNTLHSPAETSVSSLRAKMAKLLDSNLPFSSGRRSNLSSKVEVLSHTERTSLVKNFNVDFESAEMDQSFGSRPRSSLSAKNGSKTLKDHQDPSDNGKRKITVLGNDIQETTLLAVATVNRLPAESSPKDDRSFGISNNATFTVSVQNELENRHEVRPCRKLFASPKRIQGQLPSVNEAVESEIMEDNTKPSTVISLASCRSGEVVGKEEGQNNSKEVEIPYIFENDTRNNEEFSRRSVTLADHNPSFSDTSSNSNRKVICANEPERAGELNLNGPIISEVLESSRGNNNPSSHQENGISMLVRTPTKSPSFTERSTSALRVNKQNFLSSESDNDPGTSRRSNKAVSVSEILVRVLEKTRLPFSLSASRLDLQEVEALEDLVCQLKNVRKYETLYSHIQTMGSNSNPDHLKRLSEIRLLKETLLYEHARLQLRRAKHDLLLRKAPQLKSNLDELGKLKISLKPSSNVMPAPVPRVPAQEEHNETEQMCRKLSEMEEKIKALMKFFVGHHNIGGNPTPEELIQVVSGHFSKWNDCRAICQSLQLWKLADVVNLTDQCDIELNYLDFLSQRFTITFTPASRFGVDLSVKDSHVEKCFPKMNASPAFNFVFSGFKGRRKLSSVRCFQNETQACTFILGNLLDVLQEIQSALIQVPALTSSTFSLSSDDKLELELQFVDSKNGRKMALTVDLSILKCAVYPSSPAELHVTVSSPNPTPAADEVYAAVRGLKPGRPALLRLCSCLSSL